MMLTTTDVVRLAHSRPWASKPWSAELLEVFPDRLERAVDRWRLSIERAHLEGAGLPVLEVRARLGSAEVPAVVKFDGAGSDLQQQLRVLLAADGTGYVRVLEHDAELGVVLLERLGPTLSRELRDPVSQGDVIAGLLEQAWQLPLQVGLALAPDEKAKGRPTCRGSCHARSEEHTSELQSRGRLVCRPLLEKKQTSTRIDI